MLDFLYTCLTLDPVAILTAGGFFALLAIVFMESGLLIGLFLPGDSLLFAAGLLAAHGTFDITLTILGVILAAILGDNAGYWFGKNVGSRVFVRPTSHLFKKEHVIKAERFYERYGARAIVLARFVPIVRTLAPILAGIAKMEYEKFLAYNAIGAILWATSMISLGYYLGKFVPEIVQYILPVSVIIIVISFFPLILNVIRGKRL